MTLSEKRKEAINNFWNMTISGWDKVQRAEINESFPQLLVLIGCALGDMEKIMWLQEEYGREEIVRLANLNVTPWCLYVGRQLGIVEPDNDRPGSPDTVISVDDIKL